MSYRKNLFVVALSLFMSISIFAEETPKAESIESVVKSEIFAKLKSPEGLDAFNRKGYVDIKVSVNEKGALVVESLGASNRRTEKLVLRKLNNIKRKKFLPYVEQSFTMKLVFKEREK